MTLVALIVCTLLFAAVPLLLEHRRSGSGSTLATAGREVQALVGRGARAVAALAIAAAAAAALGWIVLSLLGWIARVILRALGWLF